MRPKDSTMLANQFLWELFLFFMLHKLQITNSENIRTIPKHAITRGTVQTPGAIVGTSGQSLCFSPCSVHFSPFSSFSSFHWESSVQYFDKCSPTSSAVSRMPTKFLKFLIAVMQKNPFWHSSWHPSCENNTSNLKNTKNNKNITQLLDFSYC